MDFYTRTIKIRGVKSEMMKFCDKSEKEEWFSNIRTDVLAGLVVGLALIPESIAFSAIAGVDPKSVCTHLSVSRYLLLSSVVAQQ